MMLAAAVAVIFVILILLSMPIVFALGVAGIAGLCWAAIPMPATRLRAGVGIRKAGCLLAIFRPSCAPAT